MKRILLTVGIFLSSYIPLLSAETGYILDVPCVPEFVSDNSGMMERFSFEEKNGNMGSIAKYAFRDKKGNCITVMTDPDGGKNGVWLTDPSGRELASAGREADTGDPDITMVTEPRSLDLNGDGKPDYWTGLHSHGAGKYTDGYQFILFLSAGKCYRKVIFRDTYGGEGHVGRFKGKEGYYIMVRNLIKTDYEPDNSPEEMPFMTGDDKEWAKKDYMETKKVSADKVTDDMVRDWWFYRNYDEVFFEVFYPVRISGTNLVVDNTVNPLFPLFTASGRKEPTKLLTKEQMQKEWNENGYNYNETARIVDKVIKRPLRGVKCQKS